MINADTLIASKLTSRITAAVIATLGKPHASPSPEAAAGGMSAIAIATPTRVAPPLLITLSAPAVPVHKARNNDMNVRSVLSDICGIFAISKFGDTSTEFFRSIPITAAVAIAFLWKQVSCHLEQFLYLQKLLGP
jgi:hypothetical protein